MFSLYRFQSVDSDIHLVISKLPEKKRKKKKSEKGSILKSLCVNHVAGAANDGPSAASTMPANAYSVREQHEF